MKEFELIGRLLAPIARAPAARGLRDDVAVWSAPQGRDIVLTKDMVAEGVHFLPSDPPESIAAKLLRVNLSDLAAKGATPEGVLLGFGLTPRHGEDWLTRFVTGLGEELEHFDVQLWGGDTIRAGDRLVLSLTAIGSVAEGQALSRAHARAGDDLYVTGTIGDGWLGLQALRQKIGLSGAHRDVVISRYHYPQPRLTVGRELPGLAHASADVSDGLLADAGRIADASGVAVMIELAAVPLSDAAIEWAGDDVSRRLQLATGGDDFEILFTAPPSRRAALLALSQRLGLNITRIGRVESGQGLVVLGPDGGQLDVATLGYEHG